MELRRKDLAEAEEQMHTAHAKRDKAFCECETAQAEELRDSSMEPTFHWRMLDRVWQVFGMRWIACSTWQRRMRLGALLSNCWR